MAGPTQPTGRDTPPSTLPQGEDGDSSSSDSHGKRRYSKTEDPNYSPRGEKREKRAIDTKSTPEKRQLQKSSVATYVRENAAAAYVLATNYKTPERKLRPGLLGYYHAAIPCLISRNQREMDCVELCHVIPKAVDSVIVNKLEWVWGFEPTMFNPDTRYNLIHLHAVLHASFDRGGWLLLPVEVDILEKIRETTRSPPLKSKIHKLYTDKITFRYKFIPLPPMDGTCISRRERNYTTEPGPTNTTHHYYPFRRLPIVESHVHPHFVIYNLGKKLEDFFGKRLDQERIPKLSFDKWVEHLDTFEHLRSCFRIYRSWVDVTPPLWHIQGKKGPDGGSNGDGTAEDPPRSDTGSRTTRSQTRSQAQSNHSNRGGSRGGAAGGSRSKAPKDEVSYIDPADNILFPNDSVSCQDGSPGGEGDEERNENSEHNGDSDSEFSESSWVNGLEAWRANVQPVVEEAEKSAGIEDTMYSASSSSSSDAVFSESSTMFENASGGFGWDESCGGAIGSVKQQGAYDITQAMSQIVQD